MQVCDELKLTFGPEPSELVDHILDIVKGAARMRIYNRDKISKEIFNVSQELTRSIYRDAFTATWNEPGQLRGRSII
jgi:hypothetical protein